MLNELKALVAVADSGGVMAAGTQVLRTQPAITRQLKRLEQQLGAVLFDRSRKPLRLTAEGMVVLKHARRVLVACDDLMNSVAGGPAGVFRVGIAPAANGPQCVKALATLGREFGKLNIQVFSGWSDDLRSRVREGRLEAAIVFGVQRRRPESASPLVIVGSAGHKRRLTLGEAASSPWVLSPEPCEVRTWLAQTLSAKGKELRVVAEVQDPRLQADFVASGLGLGMLPQRHLKESAGTLLEIEIVGVEAETMIAVEAGNGDRMRPVVDTLRALMTGDCANIIDQSRT